MTLGIRFAGNTFFDGCLMITESYWCNCLAGKSKLCWNPIDGNSLGGMRAAVQFLLREVLLQKWTNPGKDRGSF